MTGELNVLPSNETWADVMTNAEAWVYIVPPVRPSTHRLLLGTNVY